MRKYFKRILPVLLVLLLLLSGCNDVSPTDSGNDKTGKPTTKEAQPPASVTMLAVGDNLIHKSIYEQARQRAGGSDYDFEYTYRNVAERIKAADISIINQETLMSSLHQPSTYPTFNSPTRLGEHLINIGFDVFNIANNHSLDKGESGLISTIEFWKSQSAVFCGAYLNEEDYNKAIPQSKVNGISFAYVGATELTNGLSLPQGSEVILMQSASDEARLEERIKAASLLADVTVVNVHWGNEYTHTPTDRQRELAQKMVNWGADIIIGTHPHVIQPVEYITRMDGSEALVIYSLGNFISVQDRGPRMVGGLMDITVEKNFETGKTAITAAKFSGVVTHYGSGRSNVRVYLLSDYSETLASSHGVRANTPSFSLSYINELIKNVIAEEFR